MIQNEWRMKLKPYGKANLLKAWIQIINTLVPYMGLLVTMGIGIYFNVPYPIIFILAVPTGAFMVRAFIIFHDCTHLSFFKSKKSNQILGHILGIVTFTPYTIWQSQHNKHHGTVGNLDERGIGDVWTMTVNEYLGSGKMKRFWYRVYRNPIFLFFIAPFFLFAVVNRFLSTRTNSKSHFRSNLITNLGLLSMLLLVSFTIGIKYYLLIQLPVLFFASLMGVWLFFVQHQYDEVYWERHEEWDFVRAAIEGSSFYKLPFVLDWITGHIGYHNIHHLNPRIPNYYLKACYRDVHEFKTGKTITLLKSFRLAMLTLYDEKSKQLISIKEFRKRRIIKV
ncbi:MAG: fatty acid desaturase [Clostridia bacterium]|nr:fatty acid desaturase [Clostridia bacterium]